MTTNDKEERKKYMKEYNNRHEVKVENGINKSLRQKF